MSSWNFFAVVIVAFFLAYSDIVLPFVSKRYLVRETAKSRDAHGLCDYVRQAKLEIVYQL